MARVERSALLSFAPAQLFALVRDVARYPEFLPNCTAATIEADEAERMLASLSFKIIGITESFATENQATHFANGSSRLDMRLLRGPFKSLTGVWQFQPLGETACKVSLLVELEWGSPSLGRLLSPQLERAVTAVMQAFKQRAERIYGSAHRAV